MLRAITATPPNVNDPALVPGGSSSGAATSVAFGLAAAGIGSDTGGSVRIPSAWNDLAGLKTSHGRLTLDGVVPLCLTFDTIGPLCRTVEDNALVLAALEGGKAADIAGAACDGLRFAVLETVAMDDLRDAPFAAFQAAKERLQNAGVRISTIKIPELEEAFSFGGPLFTADSYGWWKTRVEAAPEKMFPQILERIRAGANVLAADYVAHWIRLREIREIYAKATAGFDAVILPSSPIMPPNAQKLLDDDEYYVTENLLALRNTRVANLMDVPAITLPTGHASCGIMLNGHNMCEERLLRVATAAEKALA